MNLSGSAKLCKETVEALADVPLLPLVRRYMRQERLGSGGSAVSWGKEWLKSVQQDAPELISEIP